MVALDAKSDIDPVHPRPSPTSDRHNRVIEPYPSGRGEAYLSIVGLRQLTTTPSPAAVPPPGSLSAHRKRVYRAAYACPNRRPFHATCIRSSSPNSGCEPLPMVLPCPHSVPICQGATYIDRAASCGCETWPLMWADLQSRSALIMRFVPYGQRGAPPRSRSTATLRRLMPPGDFTSDCPIDSPDSTGSFRNWA